MEDIVKAIKQIPGFKLSNSHFLLGSKVHISDFYFAKRLFQNSFFASKFAFLIAKYVISIIEQQKNKKKKDILDEGFTLLGYGLYSELLVSLVEYFLKKKLKLDDKKINHNIVNDSEEVKLIKGYEKRHKNFIVIIPISSTFSTSIKIEEEFGKQYNILSPHISVILVFDRSLSNPPTNIENKFGWETIDTSNRIITVKAFYEKGEIDKTQKYFLALPSKWYDIKDCELCFPEKQPLEEKSLNITDRTSVTPELIYDIPKGREIVENEQIKFSINPDMLEYQHFVRDKTHYHYYFYVEKFFNVNKDSIKDWLKNEIKNKIDYKDTEYALIVAPGHFSNAGFVNLVNEMLFSNSANILHFDLRKDHIENFQLFYKKEIGKADKIYFVDDTITTGNTFTGANYFIKLTREKISDKIYPGFDACIILLDRSNYFDNKNVLRKLPHNKDGSISDKLFSFANLNLPSLVTNYGECPLCKEKKRYEKLIEHSFLDCLKVHFINEATKVRQKDISTINNNQEDIAKTLRIMFNDENRYLKRVGTIHRIYQWFNGGNSLTNFNSFNDWCNDLNNRTNPPFQESKLDLNENDFSDDKATILKVIIQPPFTDYQPVRKKVFDWVIQLLNSQITKVKKEIKQNNFQYESFRNLKFLIRRAGELNANYLIRENFFNGLMRVYSRNGLDSLRSKEDIENKVLKAKDELINIEKDIEDAENIKKPNDQASLFDIIELKNKKEKVENNIAQLEYRKEVITSNSHDFSVFLSVQIKELLFLNEARSIQLEYILNRYKSHTKNFLSFQQLLRILSEENGLIIEQFWEFIKKNVKWNKKYIYEDASNTNEKIKEILEASSVNLHYKYDTLKKFFTVSSREEPYNNTSFINCLWLKNFFLIENNEELENAQESIDNNKDKLTLSQKTDSIIERLKNIVFNNDKNVGAFFIVEYYPKSNDPYFLAYNRGKSDGTIEKFKDNEFICRFIEGEDDNTGQIDSKKTIIEFNRTGEKRDEYKWLDLYSTKKDTYENGIRPNFISDNFNRLLLVRINKKFYDNQKEKIIETSKGVVGFYFKQVNQEITDANKTRYLLLLREDISSFIHKHHENNEFWEWREANIRNKLSLLTGHGRGMLLTIASNYSEYKPIVDTMLHVQQFVLNYADEKRINKETMPDKPVTLKLFKNYYAPKRADSNSEINLISEIFKMTKDIFLKFKEIEKTEKAVDIYIDNEKVDNVDKIDGKDIRINYYGDVIKLIFFELLVNAKKNRWHFNVRDVPGYQNNLVKIKIDNGNKKNLTITISSTGPIVPKDCITDLNDPSIKNIKEDGDDVAGIALIKTVLKIFKLGEINFANNLLDESTGFGEFVTKVTFYLERLFLKKN